MFSRFLFNSATRIDAAAQSVTRRLLDGTFALETRAALNYANNLRKQGHANLARALRYEGTTAAVAAEAKTTAAKAVEARKAAASAAKSSDAAALRIERDYA